MGCGHRGFPVGAFREFAIAEEREDAEVAPVFLARDRAADGNRQAVTQRASVLLDAGDLARGMADEVGVVWQSVSSWASG
jgi:hypothetical protein